MIARISGIVAAKRGGFVVIETAGVGYKVFTTPHTLSQAEQGSPLSLSTHLAVKQDALDLYGFIEETELLFFEKLLTLPGVGPKSALGIISAATVETLVHAITEEDPAYLTRMSGIGKKSAEKVVQGLKDKIGDFAQHEKPRRLKDEADIVEAIMALGYSMHEAREAARKVPEDVEGIPARIKTALKLIGGRQ